MIKHRTVISQPCLRPKRWICDACWQRHWSLLSGVSLRSTLRRNSCHSFAPKSATCVSWATGLFYLKELKNAQITFFKICKARFLTYAGDFSSCIFHFIPTYTLTSVLFSVCSLVYFLIPLLYDIVTWKNVWNKEETYQLLRDERPPSLVWSLSVLVF